MNPGPQNANVKQKIVGIHFLPEAIEIRGEIYLTVAEFQRINQEREEEGLELFANPRSLAAGTLKQLDSREVARRRLEIVLNSL